MRFPDRERGFTLVEMMVVIVIIGILTGAALVLLRGRPGLEETSHQISNQMREASRMAIAGGVVDSNEVDSGVPPPTARARVRVNYDSGRNRQQVTVELRDETLPDSPDEDEWQIVSSQYLREHIVVFGYTTSIALTEAGWDAVSFGGTTLVNSENLGGTDNVADIYFTPDGSALAGPLSLFLLDTRNERTMRVVVLALQGQPIIFSGW